MELSRQTNVIVVTARAIELQNRWYFAEKSHDISIAGIAMTKRIISMFCLQPMATTPPVFHQRPTNLARSTAIGADGKAFFFIGGGGGQASLVRVFHR